MTVGAEGVKVYGNLDHATIANTSLSLEWKPLRNLRLTTRGSYSLGRDNKDESLPLISPLSFSSRLTYSTGALSVQAEVRGHSRQSHYGGKYGETPISGWTVFNLSASYAWRSVTLRAGVENLFDKYYSTYSDWCHIPQKGRNIYTNLSFEL